MRVDLPVVLLGLVGWHLTVADHDRRRRWGGIACFALALQGKLIALTMPLAALCYLWPRNRAAAGETALGVGLLTGAGVLWQQHVSGGGYLAVIGGHALRPIHGLELLSRLYSISFPWQLALLGLILCVPLEVHRRGAAVRWMLFAGYLVAYLTGCNVGASWNYLLDLFLACWLITAVLYAARPPQPCHLNRWVRWWLVLHFGFAIAQTGCRMVALRQAESVARPALAAAHAQLAPLAAAQAKIAILGPPEAAAAWAWQGGLNWVAAAESQAGPAASAALDALADGRLDAVVRSDRDGRIELLRRVD